MVIKLNLTSKNDGFTKCCHLKKNIEVVPGLEFATEIRKKKPKTKNDSYPDYLLLLS